MDRETSGGSGRPLKGIVIARRNAGLNTTFRIRRLVAGVGVELPSHCNFVSSIQVYALPSKSMLFKIRFINLERKPVTVLLDNL
ncbi:hypothetical protein V6N13_123353 [Hibiscus sabdariffa]